MSIAVLCVLSENALEMIDDNAVMPFRECSRVFLGECVRND